MDSIDHAADKECKKIESHISPVVALLIPGRFVWKWAKQGGLIFRGGLYSPMLTLKKCIEKQLTLQSARAIEYDIAGTARVVGRNNSKKLPEVTPDGKDFCCARARLPLVVFQKALAYLAEKTPARKEMCFYGMPVGMLDGSTTAVSRTEENQKFFKGSTNQNGASRSPIVRIAFLLCSGLISAITADPYLTSELAQAAKLLLSLPGNRVLLADGLYGSFLNLVLVTQRHSHLICPRHVNRKGQHMKRLGYGQWIERLSKPRPCHCHYPELLVGMPDYVDVRVIRRVVHRKGYRDYTLVLYTTLLDPRLYPADEIVALYLKRWAIEVDIRTIKEQHGLNNLTCKTPQTVIREIYSCCLAFNCVRATMAQTGQPVHRLSHITAAQIVVKTDAKMTFASMRIRAALLEVMLELIGAAILPQQSRAPEPRALVRNVRRFPYLKGTRNQWKARHRGAA
jgi:hypothetical protein